MSNAKLKTIFLPLLLLSIPLVAMVYTDDVQWGLVDFAAAAVLLMGVGLTYECIVKRIDDGVHRIAIGLVLLVVFFLIWAELAVGIFGTPLAGS